jgi:hypothetical protein
MVGKRVKLMPSRCSFWTNLTSVKGTRSLRDVFIFRESKKSLTMDSEGVPFS